MSVDLIDDQAIGGAQFNHSGGDALDLDTMPWSESSPLKPAPHQPDFRFHATLPEVAIGLDLQRKNRRRENRVICWLWHSNSFTRFRLPTVLAISRWRVGRAAHSPPV